MFILGLRLIPLYTYLRMCIYMYMYVHKYIYYILCRRMYVYKYVYTYTYVYVYMGVFKNQGSKHYRVPLNGMAFNYPHSYQTDRNGHIWYACTQIHQIGHEGSLGTVRRSEEVTAGTSEAEVGSASEGSASTFLGSFRINDHCRADATNWGSFLWMFL